MAWSLSLDTSLTRGLSCDMFLYSEALFQYVSSPGARSQFFLPELSLPMLLLMHFPPKTLRSVSRIRKLRFASDAVSSAARLHLRNSLTWNLSPALKWSPSYDDFPQPESLSQYIPLPEPLPVGLLN